MDDLREDGLVADVFRLHGESPLLIEGSADDPISRAFTDRYRLPRHQRFVDRRRACLDPSVDRNLVARPHAEHIAGTDFGEGNFNF